MCVISHSDAIREPLAAAEKIHDFLGGGMDVQAMAAAVDPTLYRQRSLLRAAVRQSHTL